MGRPRNKTNKRRASQPPGNGKRGKRFWIEDCGDTVIPVGKICQMEVLITRVELEDNYKLAPNAYDEVKNKVATKQDEAKDEHENMTQNESKMASSEPSNKKIRLESPCSESKVIGPDEAKDEHENMTQNESKKASSEPSNKKIRLESPCSESKVIGDTKIEGETGNSDKHTLKAADDKIENAQVRVKRSAGAKQRLKKFFAGDNFKPIPNGDCGDGILNPHPKNEVADKYWSQRRRLFTRFDQGIQLDQESWFSVTPEAIANHIAAHMVQSRENLIILDPFCGCGGNSIALAKRDEVALVVCVDTDLEKLKKAAANAQIYEIPPEKMVLIHDDACDIMSFFRDGKLILKTEEDRAEVTDLGGEDCKYQIGNTVLLPEKLDMIFLSPPWGGMNYLKAGMRNYDLTSIQLPRNGTSVSGEDLLSMAATALGHKPVTYFLPRNINGIKLAKSTLKAGYEGPVVMEQNILNGKLKTVTAYIGL